MMSGLKSLVRKICVVTAVCSVLCGFTYAIDGTVTDASALNIRTETNTKSDVIAKVKDGTVLNIVGKLNDWYRVSYANKIGYVSGEYVKFASNVVVNNSTATVTGSSVNMRSGVGTKTAVVTKLIKDTSVKVLGYDDGWYHVSYGSYTGYMSGDYLRLNDVTYSTASAPATSASASAETAGTVTSEREKLIDYAKQYLGVKYAYGGASPSGFDCSGFTTYVFKNFGYSLNRSSSAQTSNGKEISKSELLPGDLVFFTRGGSSVGHVGIYIGDNKFIHSSSPGDVVKITDLDDSYYKRNYVCSRRILEA